MLKNSYMKPQDLVVLLKIIALGENKWRMLDLAHDLFISPSEISESLQRTYISGLLSESKREVRRNALFYFLVHGVKYVFPQAPGAIVRGMPTAHSAPPIRGLLSEGSSSVEKIKPNDELYVWEDIDGIARGQSIVPLFPTVPKAAKVDNELYELLAIVDVIRVGRAREVQLAVDFLQERMLFSYDRKS